MLEHGQLTIVRTLCIQIVRTAVCGALLCAPAMAAADSAKAAKYYEDGLARYERSDWAGAVIQLKNALQNDNRLLAAHLLLAKSLLQSGDLAGAEASFNEALKLGVNRAEVVVPLARMYMLLGRAQTVLDRAPAEGLPLAVKVEVLSIRGSAFAELGNYIEADKAFAAARELDPKSALPYIAEVPVRLTQGQMERARAAANRAVALAPKNAEARSLNASVLHATGNLDGALQEYSAAIELVPEHLDARIARASILLDKQRSKEAQADLDRLATISPRDPRASYLRALLASRNGDAAAAKAALLETTKHLELLPREWVNAREQFLMLGAMAYHGLNESQKARALLDTLINRNGKNAGARKLLATIYLETKEPVRAAAAIEPLLRDTPNDPQALYLLGQAQLGQRRYAQAIKTLERAAQLGANTPQTQAAIGFSHLGFGQSEEGAKKLAQAFAALPGDPQIGVALASQYMRSGQAGKAVATAEAMVAKDPNNLASLNLLGVLKASAGDRAGARAAYEQVLRRDPKFQPTHLNLARLDAAEGRIAQARARLDALLKVRPADTDAMYELGMLEQGAGRQIQAQRWFEKAYTDNPRDVKTGVALAQTYLAQAAFEPALAVARKLSNTFGDNTEVLSLLARAQLAMGDKKGAEHTFRELTKLAEYDAVMQVRIGRWQLLAGLLEGAAYNAQKALAGAPGNAEGLTLSADVEVARGNYAQAEVLARELLARHPQFGSGHRVSGDIAVARKQYAAALTAYRAALSRDATTDNALLVARAHLATGDTARAASFLEQWVSAHPDDMDARAALAEVHMRMEKWAAASAQYERVLSLRPNEKDALNNLAYVQFRLNDPRAVETAQRVATLFPHDGNVADTLGWILVQSGQVEQGLRYLREARLRQPESGTVRYHLAYALAKIGRATEARSELESALQNPTFQESREARELHAKLLR